MRSETGFVLIVILIVITLSSLWSMHYLEQQTVLVKLLCSAKQHAQDLFQAENRLLEAEDRVLKNPDRGRDKEGLFVPDHLAFDCKHGQQILTIEADPFQSFVSIPHRRPSDQGASTRTQCFEQARAAAEKSLGQSLGQASMCLAMLAYQGHLRPVLMLVAEAASDRQIHLWVFEISESGDCLRQRIHQPLPKDYSLDASSKAVCIRRVGGALNIVFSVCKGLEGAVLCIDPESRAMRSIPVSRKAISSLVALDLKGRGVCEAIYIGNHEGLWMIALDQPVQQALHTLGAVSVDSKIRVLPHRHRIGVEVYFLGRRADQQGLWRATILEDNPLKRPERTIDLQCVLEGDFSGFSVRAGRILLLTENQDAQALVWDSARQRRVSLRTEQQPGRLAFRRMRDA